MAGIAGIAETDREQVVEHALGAIAHRGSAGRMSASYGTATLGCVWPDVQSGYAIGNRTYPVVLDGEIHNWTELAPGATCALEALHQAYLTYGPRFVARLDGPFAVAIAERDGLYLARDMVGKCPLYIGFRADTLCFASELKALAGWAEDIIEFPPGHYCEPGQGTVLFAQVTRDVPVTCQPQKIAAQLCGRLVSAVHKRLGSGAGEIGVWLSGGLDSAAMAALAARQVPRLHTFSIGMKHSPDLVFARALAEYLGTAHHERVCTTEEVLSVLPQVIYHLESFDALLVRSSAMNYLLGELSADHVPAVLSGEGGDELFAGYSYLRDLETADLPDELIDITKRLHNTALQRVDRCSASHGLVARTAFLDRAVIDYAVRIPPYLKIHENGHTVGKWILRVALDGLLPEPILWRPKAKFWEGSGLGEQLATHAESVIADAELEAERGLPGLHLYSKEELFYYRIFRDVFGDTVSARLVGRTKAVPAVR